MDMKALATGSLSDRGKPLPLMHPVTGEPLTIGGQPVVLLVAGQDSAAMRRGMQAIARSYLEEYERAYSKHRKAVGMEGAFSKATPAERDAETVRRAHAEIGILQTGADDRPGTVPTEFVFTRRVELAAYGIVGWSGVVYDGSPEFSHARAVAFLTDCPWVLDQLSRAQTGRAYFLAE